MADVDKPRLYRCAQANHLAVPAGAEALEHSLGIVHVIERHIPRMAGALRLAVAPLRFKHLNVRAVAQHNPAQILRRFRRNHGAAETLRVQQRQAAGMIDVRMRQQNVINLRRINRYLLILILVRSLLHTAVDQNMKPADLQIVAASRHFMGGPKKIQFHDGSFPPDVSGTRFPFRSQAAGVRFERRMHPRMTSVLPLSGVPLPVRRKSGFSLYYRELHRMRQGNLGKLPKFTHSPLACSRLTEGSSPMIRRYVREKYERLEKPLCRALSPTLYFPEASRLRA